MKPPEGFWSFGEGNGGGAGSADGIVKAIDAQADIPQHAKAALKAFIAAELDGTSLNFITVHAHQQRRDDGLGRHTVWTFSVDARKSLT